MFKDFILFFVVQDSKRGNFEVLDCWSDKSNLRSFKLQNCDSFPLLTFYRLNG